MFQQFASKAIVLCGAAAVTAAPVAIAGSVVEINGQSFDLDQYIGASVTYRTDADGGDVDFDGKYWDNIVGVDGVTLGELAAGQFGSDPGDQVSLNNRVTPDWLQLNYGTGQTIAPGATEFVVFEITSSSSGVDTEGLSWMIGFNGAAPVAVSASQVSFFASPGDDGLGNDAENTNMAVFDLVGDFGFSLGDTITSVYIENINSGSGTSDPDFIFAGITTATVVPTPSAAIGGLALFGGLAVRRRRRAQ